MLISVPTEWRNNNSILFEVLPRLSPLENFHDEVRYGLW
jgi:hypothetical protein